MGYSQNNANGDSDADRNTGLFKTLKGIAATLIASGRTRLELLGNEIEEEKLRALRLLLMALAMVFCFGVGILLCVAFLTALFWDSKLLVLGGFATLFILLGALFLQAAHSATQRSEPLFAGSLAELEEDLRQLKAAARNESTTD